MNSKTLYLINSRKFLILIIIILISNNLLSQITFERINENTDGVYRKTTLYQNKIYVAGDKFSEELQTGEYFIALLDTNCNEIWRKTYAITHEEFNTRIVITDLVPDTNNNCFYASFQVVYFYNGNTVAYKESYIVKFSENGILQWKHMTSRFTGTNPSNSSQVCVNSNGNISYFNPLVQKTSKGGFYISSLSPYGDSLYSINIQIDTINYLIPTRMIYMNNSFYISCMAKDENNKNEAQPCFLKVNENGQVDWLKKYIIIENASLDDGISDLVFRNNSFYILAYFGGWYYTYLIKVDINGNLQY